MARLVIVGFAMLGLAGCGGAIDLTCDDVATYQLAVEGKRVDAPDDLDELDVLREVPLPEASPQPPRPPNSPCIDLPPEVRIS